jgi:hypothetical protein
METENMEKTETTRSKEQTVKGRKQIMGGALVDITVPMFEPYIRFGKEYLAFFGSKDSFQILCMKLIHDGLHRLHRDLTEFIQDKDSPHFIDGSEWYEKHSHMAIVSDQPEDE